MLLQRLRRWHALTLVSMHNWRSATRAVVGDARRYRNPPGLFTPPTRKQSGRPHRPAVPGERNVLSDAVGTAPHCCGVRRRACAARLELKRVFLCQRRPTGAPRTRSQPEHCYIVRRLGGGGEMTRRCGSHVDTPKGRPSVPAACYMPPRFSHRVGITLGRRANAREYDGAVGRC